MQVLPSLYISKTGRSMTEVTVGVAFSDTFMHAWVQASMAGGQCGSRRRCAA